MDYIRANVTIEGVSPMSQSHMHSEPKLEGEGNDDYDARTWRMKLNTETVGGKDVVVIPAFGLQTAIADAAKYSKRQIPGQGKATWTGKFKAGLSVLAPVALGIDPTTVKSVTISANADGVRGSGKRVTRRFPQLPPGWQATFEVIVLDPIITEDIFREMLELAGLFVGVGQFRPQNGGTNGRFRVVKIDWQDNRREVPSSRPRKAA
ncbi:MAG: hypothetical protein ACYC3L_00840 [Gemmatimonadaceae bacterium]